MQVARSRGARVAVINYDDETLGSASSLGKDDFLFVGDAAEILPVLVEGVVGIIGDDGVVKEKEENQNAE